MLFRTLMHNDVARRGLMVLRLAINFFLITFIGRKRGCHRNNEHVECVFSLANVYPPPNTGWRTVKIARSVHQPMRSRSSQVYLRGISTA